MQYKDNLVNKDNKVVSKLSKVWTDISRELNCNISENGLYTLVVKSHFQLKDKILNINSTTNTSKQDNSCNIDLSTSPNVSESTLEESNYDANRIIKITFEKKELENLIIMKQYVRTEKYRPQIRFRKYEILQPGVWQQLITEKLWNIHKIECAYHFKRNKVYNNTSTINGKCNCGSVINGVINNLNFEKDNIMICECTKGTSICGKRILRNSERAQIGKILWDRHLTAEVYRAERGEDLMTIDPEPPHLYSAKTMRNAKQEYSQNMCIDKEPLQSLLIAQESVYKNIIHNIGLNSFYVHYWSNHQIAIYERICCARLFVNCY